MSIRYGCNRKIDKLGLHGPTKVANNPEQPRLCCCGRHPARYGIGAVNAPRPCVAATRLFVDVSIRMSITTE